MTTDSLIASLVSSLAWPLATILLGYIFRQQLRAVFTSLAERVKHLTNIKAPGTELSFAETLIEAGTEIERMELVAADAIEPDVPDIEPPKPEHGSHDAELIESKIGGPPKREDAGGGKRTSTVRRPVSFRSEWLVTPINVAATDAVSAQIKESPAETVAIAWNSVAVTLRQVAAGLGMSDDASYDSNFYPFAVSVLSNLRAVGAMDVDVNGTLKVIQRLWDIKSRVLNGYQPISALEAYGYARVARDTVRILAPIRNELGHTLYHDSIRDRFQPEVVQPND